MSDPTSAVPPEQPVPPPRPVPPEQSSNAGDVRENDQGTYAGLAARADFAELKRRYRMFAFPATIAFMVWYVTYVICNNWARGFMDTQVVGNINIALVFGLLQFVSTFAIAFLYARHAGKTLDPLATRLRTDFDTETGR